MEHYDSDDAEASGQVRSCPRSAALDKDCLSSVALRAVLNLAELRLQAAWCLARANP